MVVASFLIYLKKIQLVNISKDYSVHQQVLDFEHTALLYDFTFERFENLTDFKYMELSAMGSHIYEVLTSRENNLQQHQILYKKLSDIVNVTL